MTRTQKQTSHTTLPQLNRPAGPDGHSERISFTISDDRPEHHTCLPTGEAQDCVNRCASFSLGCLVLRGPEKADGSAQIFWIDLGFSGWPSYDGSATYSSAFAQNAAQISEVLAVPRIDSTSATTVRHFLLQDPDRPVTAAVVPARRNLSEWRTDAGSAAGCQRAIAPRPSHSGGQRQVRILPRG